MLIDWTWLIGKEFQYFAYDTWNVHWNLYFEQKHFWWMGGGCWEYHLQRDDIFNAVEVRIYVKLHEYALCVFTTALLLKYTFSAAVIILHVRYWNKISFIHFHLLTHYHVVRALTTRKNELEVLEIYLTNYILEKYVHK
jgi:hypothetical protein